MGLNENLNKLLKGTVKFRLVGKDGTEKVWEQPNAIQFEAKTIICNALSDQPLQGTITGIVAYKASSLLNTATVIAYTFPTSSSVAFGAVFDEASFDDTLDELRLYCDGMVMYFSIITGLSITKDNLSRLYVEWKITINDIP